MDQVRCQETGLCDHSLIFGVLVDEVVERRHTLRMIKCFRGCDLEGFVEDLSSAPWNVMESLKDMDSQWEH